MISVAEQKRRLQEAGYVVLHVEPGRYRVRGLAGFATLWLVDCLYKSEYSSLPPKSYDPEDVVEVVRSLVLPFDVPTRSQMQATERWREGLEALTVRYPHMAGLRTGGHTVN